MILAGFYSCKEQDSVYEEFLVPNGHTYPQKPDSLQAFAGYERLRITWRRAADPTVERAIVYWNNYTDSIVVDIDRTDETIAVDIDNLRETTYTVYVKTIDHKGNMSIPSQTTGTPYGPNYILSATDRSVSRAVRNDELVGTVTWGSRTTDLLYSEIRYKTASSGGAETNTVRVYPETASVICPDILPGEKYETRSVFQPPKGIDLVERDWQESEFPFLYLYPRTGWTATAKGGNHAWGDGGGGQPNLIFDGNMNTGWHSNTNTALPQCIAVDMKAPKEINSIIIYPHPNTIEWRYINNVDLYLSLDTLKNVTPQPAEALAVSLTDTWKAASITFTPPTGTTAQFAALVFKDSKSGYSYISFMEFEVYGY